MQRRRRRRRLQQLRGVGVYRLVMDAQLRPRDDLEQLLQRPIPSCTPRKRERNRWVSGFKARSSTAHSTRVPPQR